MAAKWLLKSDLVRLPRLSVMPVADAQGSTIVAMAGMNTSSHRRNAETQRK